MSINFDNLIINHSQAWPNGEDDVYGQLSESELEQKIVSSKANEINQFVAAYWAFETLIRKYPANDVR